MWEDSEAVRLSVSAFAKIDWSSVLARTLSQTQFSSYRTGVEPIMISSCGSHAFLHRGLQSVVSPSGGSNEAWEMIREWLCVWTSETNGIPVDHGIPQGSIAVARYSNPGICFEGLFSGI
jgi:hypothetical protein